VRKYIPLPLRKLNKKCANTTSGCTGTFLKVIVKKWCSSCLICAQKWDIFFYIEIVYKLFILAGVFEIEYTGMLISP
jgi:hypothetical protein